MSTYSSPYTRAIGRGIATGLAIGAVWATGRVLSRLVGPNLINWSMVRKLAMVTAGRHAEPWPQAQSVVRDSYATMVRQSEDLIAKYVGFHLPAPMQSIHVFGRQEWVDANINNFRYMFDPLEEAYRQAWQQTSVGEAMRGFSQSFLSAQMGLLLGY